MADLTSANSVLILSVDGLYNSIAIQGYSVDDAFATDDVKPTEVLMGVDGKLSAGYTPYPVPLHVMLQADSASIPVFDTWLTAMAGTKTMLFGNVTIMVPALLTTWTLTKGALTSASVMPGAKKIMQPRRYEITFESAVAMPI